MNTGKYSLYALIASAIVLLIGDVLQVTQHQNILWTVCLAISFLLFIGGIPAINSLLNTTNNSLRLIINVCLLIGSIAGAGMQVLFRSIIVLENHKLTEAVRVLSEDNSLRFTTMVPGILFPIGLIILSIALFLTKKYPAWKVVILLIGAILFPVGHAVGNPIALVAGDILLISAWIALSQEILNPDKV